MPGLSPDTLGQRAISLLYRAALKGNPDNAEDLKSLYDVASAAVIPSTPTLVQSIQLFPWNHTFPCGCQALKVEWNRDAIHPDDAVFEGKIYAEYDPNLDAIGGHRYRMCPMHGDLAETVKSYEDDPSIEGYILTRA